MHLGVDALGIAGGVSLFSHVPSAGPSVRLYPRSKMNKLPWRSACQIGIALVMTVGCAPAGPEPVTPTRRPTFTPSPTVLPEVDLHPSVDRMLEVTAYHLDLWDRQAPVLDDRLQEGDTEDADEVAWAIAGNGAAFRWALDQAGLPFGGGRCWRTYRELAGRVANGIGNFGDFVRTALQTGGDSDWDNARATRSIFTANRIDLNDLREGSLACESGGPVPSEVPLRVSRS